MPTPACLLPLQMQSLVPALGEEGVLRLMAAVGGVSVDVPKNPERLPPQLSARLAPETAAALCRVCGGSKLYVPRIVQKMQRRRLIQLEFDARLAAGETARAAVQALALEHQMSDRAVELALKAPTVSDDIPKLAPQMALDF